MSTLETPPNEASVSGTKLFAECLFDLRRSERALLRRHGPALAPTNVEVFDLFTTLYWSLKPRHPKLPRGACFVAMTLFPWNPLPGGITRQGASFGDAVGRRIRRLRRDQHSAHVRAFEELLETPLEQLPQALFPFVRLTGRGRPQDCIPLDWSQFIKDLHRWPLSGENVQEKWANDFIEHVREAN